MSVPTFLIDKLKKCVQASFHFKLIKMTIEIKMIVFGIIGQMFERKVKIDFKISIFNVK